MRRWQSWMLAGVDMSKQTCLVRTIPQRDTFPSPHKGTWDDVLNGDDSRPGCLNEVGIMDARSKTNREC